MLRTAAGAELSCAIPPEFGGELGKQSPEYLLTEALAACFVLTFRAIAAASGAPWLELGCDVAGVLDREDRKLRFTGFTIKARLVVQDQAVTERARLLLEKAEQNCLVSRSLSCPVRLESEVAVR